MCFYSTLNLLFSRGNKSSSWLGFPDLRFEMEGLESLSSLHNLILQIPSLNPSDWHFLPQNCCVYRCSPETPVPHLHLLNIAHPLHQTPNYAQNAHRCHSRNLYIYISESPLSIEVYDSFLLYSSTFSCSSSV